jgi:hypothetical protein
VLGQPLTCAALMVTHNLTTLDVGCPQVGNDASTICGPLGPNREEGCPHIFAGYGGTRYRDRSPC